MLGVYNLDGNCLVSYTYDAWGNFSTSSSFSNLNGNIAKGLPFRYRSYYFDTESGFYYLNSRYYDPYTGRFINADAISYLGANGDLESFNLFTYCSNNPTNYRDDSGCLFKYIWNLRKTIFRASLKLAVNVAEAAGINTTAVGAYLLNMKMDDNDVYHASFDCWQQYFGYNDLFDIVFDLGTTMEFGKFVFECNDVVYAIWLWKGDYINLGAGAEIGIYYGGPLIWFVDKSLAMSMSMSVIYDGLEIINHSDIHWWLTGFDPSHKDININSLSASFTIKFQRLEMFWAFYYDPDSYGWLFDKIALSATYTL